MGFTAYDAGTTMYTGSIAACAAAATVPGNPVLSYTSRFAAVTIGSMFCSPSDIADIGKRWKELNGQINDISTELTKLMESLPEETWKKLGRPDFQAVVDTFNEQKKKNQELNINMGDTLENYAGLFFAGAIVCSVGAAGLLIWAFFALASAPNPLARAFAFKVAALYGEAFRDITKKMLVKNLLVLSGGIGLVMAIQQFFTMSMTDDLRKTASPTDMNSIPQFKEAVIKNLPTAESNQSEGTSGLAGESPSSRGPGYGEYGQARP